MQGLQGEQLFHFFFNLNVINQTAKKVALLKKLKICDLKNRIAIYTPPIFFHILLM